MITVATVASLVIEGHLYTCGFAYDSGSPGFTRRRHTDGKGLLSVIQISQQSCLDPRAFTFKSSSTPSLHVNLQTTRVFPALIGSDRLLPQTLGLLMIRLNTAQLANHRIRPGYPGVAKGRVIQLCG